MGTGVPDRFSKSYDGVDDVHACAVGAVLPVTAGKCSRFLEDYKSGRMHSMSAIRDSVSQFDMEELFTIYMELNCERFSNRAWYKCKGPDRSTPGQVWQIVKQRLVTEFDPEFTSRFGNSAMNDYLIHVPTVVVARMGSPTRQVPCTEGAFAQAYSIEIMEILYSTDHGRAESITEILAGPKWLLYEYSDQALPESEYPLCFEMTPGIVYLFAISEKVSELCYLHYHIGVYAFEVEGDIVHDTARSFGFGEYFPLSAMRDYISAFTGDCKK